MSPSSQEGGVESAPSFMSNQEREISRGHFESLIDMSPLQLGTHDKIVSDFHLENAKGCPVPDSMNKSFAALLVYDYTPVVARARDVNVFQGSYEGHICITCRKASDSLQCRVSKASVKLQKYPHKKSWL